MALGSSNDREDLASHLVSIGEMTKSSSDSEISWFLFVGGLSS